MEQTYRVPLQTVIDEMNVLVLADFKRKHIVINLDGALDPQTKLTHYGRAVMLAHLFKEHYVSPDYRKTVGAVLVMYNSQWVLTEKETIKELSHALGSLSMLKEFFKSVLLAMNQTDSLYPTLASVWNSLPDSDAITPKKKKQH